MFVAVRRYLRYGLSYRDLEELLAECGIEVDHVTLYRRVQRFAPILIEAPRRCRQSVDALVSSREDVGAWRSLLLDVGLLA